MLNLAECSRDFFLVILGAIIALLADFILRYLDSRSKQKHNASILLYDLKSIESYFTNPKLKNEIHITNLRYTENWQTIIAECSFLSSEHIMLLYSVYDNVYDYNYLYNMNHNASNQWLTETNNSSNVIRSIIKNDKWHSIIDYLEKKV